MNEEFKKMIGDRQKDSDGFTYSYGKFNDYQNRDKTRIKRCLRTDKRRVKREEERYEREAEGD